MFTRVHFLDGVEDFPPEAHWAFNLLLKLRSPSVLGLNITSSRLDSYLNLKSGSFFPPNWTLKTGLLPAPLWSPGRAPSRMLQAEGQGWATWSRKLKA